MSSGTIGLKLNYLRKITDIALARRALFVSLEKARLKVLAADRMVEAAKKNDKMSWWTKLFFDPDWIPTFEEVDKELENFVELDKKLCWGSRWGMYFETKDLRGLKRGHQYIGDIARLRDTLTHVREDTSWESDKSEFVDVDLELLNQIYYWRFHT
jgi:hypothetical protein